MKKKYYKVKKYRVQQLTTCEGYRVSKSSMEYGRGNSFATDDVNEAYQKMAEFEKRIADTGKHSSSCMRFYYGKKCKAKFEVQEKE